MSEKLNLLILNSMQLCPGGVAGQDFGRRNFISEGF